VVVRGADGSRLLDNAAYRALGLDAAASPAAGGASEEELSVGEPARTFVATTVPVADAGGTLTCLREVTRERQALRAKDELIATMGHELRNPLTSIHGYSQLMARQLESVRRQVDQLNRLIGDFMEAARLEGGQLPLKREVVDLAQVAAAAAERFRGAFAGRQLRLELTTAVPVEGDPARLAQVVDNLLSNAAKYSPPDAEIALAVRVEGERAVLAVRDRGVGITSEHLPRLFERSYRAPGAGAQTVEGLGLGLALVRDLVAAHGGQVRAESAGPGTGSTFAISLPVAAAPPSDRASDTNGSAGAAPVATS
jgi:signal transduction histidine kinase